MGSGVGIRLFGYVLAAFLGGFGDAETPGLSSDGDHNSVAG